jgi:hypothetical protein
MISPGTTFWPNVLSATGPLEESGREVCAPACVTDRASAVASALAATVRCEQTISCG